MRSAERHIPPFNEDLLCFHVPYVRGWRSGGTGRIKKKNHPNKNFVNFLEKNKPTPSDFLSLTVLAATQLTENVSHMKLA